MTDLTYRMEIHMSDGNSFCLIKLSDDELNACLKSYHAGEPMTLTWPREVVSVTGTYPDYADRAVESLPHTAIISPWNVTRIEYRPMTTTGK